MTMYKKHLRKLAACFLAFALSVSVFSEGFMSSAVTGWLECESGAGTTVGPQYTGNAPSFSTDQATVGSYSVKKTLTNTAAWNDFLFIYGANVKDISSSAAFSFDFYISDLTKFNTYWNNSSCRLGVQLCTGTTVPSDYAPNCVAYSSWLPNTGLVQGWNTFTFDLSTANTALLANVGFLRIIPVDLTKAYALFNTDFQSASSFYNASSLSSACTTNVYVDNITNKGWMECESGTGTTLGPQYTGNDPSFSTDQKSVGSSSVKKTLTNTAAWNNFLFISSAATKDLTNSSTFQFDFYISDLSKYNTYWNNSACRLGIQLCTGTTVPADYEQNRIAYYSYLPNTGLVQGWNTFTLDLSSANPNLISSVGFLRIVPVDMTKTWALSSTDFQGASSFYSASGLSSSCTTTLYVDNIRTKGWLECESNAGTTLGPQYTGNDPSFSTDQRTFGGTSAKKTLTNTAAWNNFLFISSAATRNIPTRAALQFDFYISDLSKYNSYWNNSACRLGLQLCSGTTTPADYENNRIAYAAYLPNTNLVQGWNTFTFELSSANAALLASAGFLRIVPVDLTKAWALTSADFQPATNFYSASGLGSSCTMNVYVDNIRLDCTDYTNMRSGFLFGVTGHNTSRPAYTANTIEDQIHLAAELGVGMYRFDASSDMAWNDKVVALCESYGLQMMPLVSSSSVASTMATRYAGHIKYYQMLNETDNQAILSGNGDQISQYDMTKVNNFVTQLKSIASAIRAGDPNAKLVINGTFLHYAIFDYFISQGVDFDVLGWDWYSNQDSYAGGVAGIAKILLDRYPTKNLFFCEGNYWPVGSGYPVEGDYITACMRTVYNLKSPRILGYCVYELLDEPNQGAPENTFGLVNVNSDYSIGSVKTAYTQVQTVLGGTAKTKTTLDAALWLNTESSCITTLGPSYIPNPAQWTTAQHSVGKYSIQKTLSNTAGYNNFLYLMATNNRSLSGSNTLSFDFCIADLTKYNTYWNNSSCRMAFQLCNGTSIPGDYASGRVVYYAYLPQTGLVQGWNTFTFNISSLSASSVGFMRIVQVDMNKSWAISNSDFQPGSSFYDASSLSSSCVTNYSVDNIRVY